MFSVNNCDDCIKTQLSANFFIHKERLSDWCRISKSRRLDQYVIELVFSLHECSENANEISTNSAADAAIVHFENLFFGIDD